jgi:hypothetical protein
LPIFDPQKCYNPLSPPPSLQIYLRQTIFFSPKFKTRLKGLHFADVAEIQEGVTHELKKVQKEFSAAFLTLYDRAKACANGAYFEF